jgi:hypothetical protein
MHARTRIAAMAMLLSLDFFAFAAEPKVPLDRARQLGNLYAIGKEGCNVPDIQLAAFKRQADKELHGDKILIAAYEKSLAETITAIRNDKDWQDWQSSPDHDRSCVPTRLLFAMAAMKG